jgi:hypothetical protein
MVCLYIIKEVVMIGTVQLKRMIQLVIIILCTLFLLHGNARAQGNSVIERQTPVRAFSHSLVVLSP